MTNIEWSHRESILESGTKLDVWSASVEHVRLSIDHSVTPERAKYPAGDAYFAQARNIKTGSSIMGARPTLEEAQELALDYAERIA